MKYRIYSTTIHVEYGVEQIKPDFVRMNRIERHRIAIVPFELNGEKEKKANEWKSTRRDDKSKEKL